MPFNQVMHKFKAGQLKSGSSSGKPVKNRNQAIAIMLSEKKKADSGDEEYKADSSGVGPSDAVVKEATSLRKKKPPFFTKKV